MAAFSYQQQNHNPFVLDFAFQNPKLSSALMEDSSFNFNFNPSIVNTNNLFSQFCSPEITSLDQSSNEPSSVTVNTVKKQSTDSSSAVDKLESGEQVTQTVNRMDKKRKNRSGSSSNSAISKEPSDVVKGKKQRKCSEEKKNTNKALVPADEEEQQPPKGYIHVRARRGQATDSHSLAERVRREKISERMKMLQKLVPGCDKVTGKALMLDEIINYVQSLQNQVEFLSMKLASVNPMFYDYGVMDLDSMILRPEITSPFVDTTTTGIDNFPVLDTAASSCYFLQQGQRPGVFSSQESSSLLLDMEDQKQKFLNPSGFTTNNLCSFH